jgi:hypothetical protein
MADAAGPHSHACARAGRGAARRADAPSEQLRGRLGPVHVLDAGRHLKPPWRQRLAALVLPLLGCGLAAAAAAASAAAAAAAALPLPCRPPTSAAALLPASAPAAAPAALGAARGSRPLRRAGFGSGRGASASAAP